MASAAQRAIPGSARAREFGVSRSGREAAIALVLAAVGTVDDHPIVEPGDDAAAGSFTHGGDERVNEAGDCAEEHRRGKREGVTKMLAIAFPDRSGVGDKQALDHVILLCRTSSSAGRECFSNDFDILLNKQRNSSRKSKRENVLLDLIDRKILRCLQADSSRSLGDIAGEVGLSSSPCWKRIKRLEAEGYIVERVTILDRERLDLGVTVFAAVKTNQHHEAWLDDFARAVSAIPEVVEFYRMSGDVDYMLKIVCRDIADYDRIYRSLIKRTAIYDVSSSFAMEQIKCTTQLPI
jgi:Lrp/AsnC family transcriptional regulator